MKKFIKITDGIGEEQTFNLKSRDEKLEFLDVLLDAEGGERFEIEVLEDPDDENEE